MTASAHAPAEGVTKALARYALGHIDTLAPAALAEARRAFVNYTGCVLGGANEPAVLHALALADEFSGPRHCTVMGQPMRLDARNAALVNCLASSIHTFDDSHLSSVSHPTGPVAGAALALLQHRENLKVDGREFLTALALGVEIGCRVARAMTVAPAQPALGLFTTGLMGGIGAAAACARLLGLDVQRTAWAIGIAAAQGCGFRATHATMSGGLVPALAARAGLDAALLAEKGFDCNDAALEGPNGFFAVYAPGADVSATLQGLGTRYELLELSYKPYPCGVVIHPAIDACIELAGQLGGAAIERVDLRVHPLALQLTGLRHPAGAFDTKVSLYHWSAAALLRGHAGLAEATDAAVCDPAIAALRERVDAQPDAQLARDAADVSVRLADGRVIEAQVAHARGSRERPLSDEDLDLKFMLQAGAVLPQQHARDLLALCNALPGEPAGWLRAFGANAVPG